MSEERRALARKIPTRGRELAKAKHVRRRVRCANAKKGISNAKRTVEEVKGIEITKNRGKELSKGQTRREERGKEKINQTRRRRGSPIFRVVFPRYSNTPQN